MPTPEKETEKKPDKNKDLNDGIWSDIDDKSVKAMLKAGRIYPSLKPRLNIVYIVKVIGVPKSFDSKAYGIAHSIDIFHNNMNMSLVLAKSFRQQLKPEMIRQKLIDKDNEPDFQKLVGKTLKFQKILGNTKTMENVPLYSVQID